MENQKAKVETRLRTKTRIESGTAAAKAVFEHLLDAGTFYSEEGSRCVFFVENTDDEIHEMTHYSNVNRVWLAWLLGVDESHDWVVFSAELIGRAAINSGLCRVFPKTDDPFDAVQKIVKDSRPKAAKIDAEEWSRMVRRQPQPKTSGQ